MLFQRLCDDAEVQIEVLNEILEGDKKERGIFILATMIKVCNEMAANLYDIFFASEINVEDIVSGKWDVKTLCEKLQKDETTEVVLEEIINKMSEIATQLYKLQSLLDTLDNE